MILLIHPETGDRRSIPDIDYTNAVRLQGWIDEREYDPDADKLYLMAPLPEEIAEFNTAHPALALLNDAQSASELTVLPSVGKARAADILALRVSPWESLEAAADDLSEVSLDWEAIASWQG